MSYRLTRRAHCDLIEIGDYIARHDPAAASRLIALIEEKCTLVGRNIDIGPARPDLAPGLRYVLATDYLILYRAVAGGAEVVRILHGARNVVRRLR